MKQASGRRWKGLLCLRLLPQRGKAIAKLHSPLLHDTFRQAPNLLRVQLSWCGCNYLPGTLLSNAATARPHGEPGSAPLQVAVAPRLRLPGPQPPASRRKAAMTQLLPRSHRGARKLRQVHLNLFREQQGRRSRAAPPGGPLPSCRSDTREQQERCSGSAPLSWEPLLWPGPHGHSTRGHGRVSSGQRCQHPREAGS